MRVERGFRRALPPPPSALHLFLPSPFLPWPLLLFPPPLQTAGQRSAPFGTHHARAVVVRIFIQPVSSRRGRFIWAPLTGTQGPRRRLRTWLPAFSTPRCTSPTDPDGAAEPLRQTRQAQDVGLKHDRQVEQCICGRLVVACRHVRVCAARQALAIRATSGVRERASGGVVQQVSSWLSQKVDPCLRGRRALPPPTSTDDLAQLALRS